MVLVSDLNAVIGTAIAGTVLLSIGVNTLARRRVISKKDAEQLRLKFGDFGERFAEKPDPRRLAFVGAACGAAREDITIFARPS